MANETSGKQTLWQVIKFTLFSISAGIIETVVFTLLQECFQTEAAEGLSYWICYLPALIASVVWNFTLNRRYTFKSATNVPIAMLKVAIFYVFFTPLSAWGGQWLTDLGWNEYLVFALTPVCNLVLEYLYCRFVVYRNSMNTNDLAQKEDT